jgi:threonylcarbamoyladenosine tRNA methylthiotransferase CDKAL1
MKERSRKLNELKTRIALQNNHKLLDKNLEVLITGKGIKGGFIGRTNSYKTVVVDKASLGSFVNVNITEVKGTYLLGRKI